MVEWKSCGLSPGIGSTTDAVVVKTIGCNGCCWCGICWAWDSLLRACEMETTGSSWPGLKKRENVHIISVSGHCTHLIFKICQIVAGTSMNCIFGGFFLFILVLTGMLVFFTRTGKHDCCLWKHPPSHRLTSIWLGVIYKWIKR